MHKLLSRNFEKYGGSVKKVPVPTNVVNHVIPRKIVGATPALFV